MPARQKLDQKRATLYANLENFFQEIEKKYGVTREEVLRVADELGAIKGRISTYFLVETYMRRKRDNK
jgi:hypothetical protein